MYEARLTGYRFLHFPSSYDRLLPEKATTLNVGLDVPAHASGSYARFVVISSKTDDAAKANLKHDLETRYRVLQVDERATQHQDREDASTRDGEPRLLPYLQSRPGLGSVTFLMLRRLFLAGNR